MLIFSAVLPLQIPHGNPVFGTGGFASNLCCLYMLKPVSAVSSD